MMQTETRAKLSKLGYSITLCASIAVNCFSSNQSITRDSEYPSISSIHSPPAKRVQRFDFVDFNDDMAEPEPTDGVEDELQRYLESRGSKEEISQYWKSNSHNYPTMAKLAINVLGIPASSSSPERCFSALKLLVTDNRYNLSGSLISKILIAKSL
ncbi:hypothetical protein DdX_02603 [Ditylenchus destructor]|uniref:HAT C-terminal dimerisation domain-containing protein n=1 Tax=Ditylenchus destructor TaxID=166010 RepID=A0AAD4NI27_9BILA|nr:hypothetical protein DdX_02603 [Ditylenchus destructor]